MKIKVPSSLPKDISKQPISRESLYSTAPKIQENPDENSTIQRSSASSKTPQTTVTTTRPRTTSNNATILPRINETVSTNIVVEKTESIEQSNLPLTDNSTYNVNDSSVHSHNIQVQPKGDLKIERTKQPSFVGSDFVDETYFEPYCAMQSNAHKYLVWPDTPTDLTDWTYTRKRKCPKITIPDNITNTKRVKYSLKCDNDMPALIPSFTNRSDDIWVVTLKESCLASFINRCCNDSRGIPNIVHYVWYFKKEMKFCMFLSMISIIRYVRPCLILFHGEYLPYGKYWDYIIRIYPNVVHVKRPRPLYIFGKKIAFHEHSGDIMRMDALMELGGMYFDADVIVLRDIEPLRKYDMTLCLQASGFLLNAFIMSKKNATFLALWMEGYRKDYRNNSYEYNSMLYNNDLAKKRTDLLHIEKGTLCAPAIIIGRPINDTLRYDWSKLYGFHLYARTIHFPWDVNWIKNFNTTMGSMVRHVVYGNKELCE